MSQPAEQRWRIFVPLLRGDGETFLERLRTSTEENPHLVAFLDSQRLAAATAAAVEDLGLTADLPAGLYEELRSRRRSQYIMAIENLRAAADLHGWLSDVGIAHLFLKGPLLGLRAFGGIEHRTVGDIDLLIHPEAIDAAEEELLSRGFVVRYGTFGGRGLSRFFVHHFSYSKKQQMAEVHWHLVRESGIRVDMEAVWAKAEHVDFRQTEFPVPSLETSLLIQVLGIAKDLELGLLALRSFADTYAILVALGADFDWARFLEGLAAQGAGELAPAVLELTLRMMECHAELPELAAIVDEKLDSISSLDKGQATLGLEVFELQPPAWPNKRLLYPLHRGGPIRTWAWWALSFPIRKAVYKDS